MESKFLEGKIGNDGAYVLEFKAGKLLVEASYAVSGVEGKVTVAVGAEAVLDALAKAIPGQIDDKVIEVIKKALAA